ncbi:uncharacterized protein LOC117326576 [Pecten maximus]|uniref:uncharacterized protein LOC117326576 n=1 Tax=Pecten maximus TaxID=6579 RepID=UPI00145888AF|nr:uncharacterized protein LOC117326576 [Pecten maximus]
MSKYVLTVALRTKTRKGMALVFLYIRNKKVDLATRKPTEGADLYPVCFSIEPGFDGWIPIDDSLDEVLKSRMGTKIVETRRESGVPSRSEDREVKPASYSVRYDGRLHKEALDVITRHRYHGDAFLSLWDMGGHMSFQASHNIFISSHGVYIIVFRPTDFLKDKLETDRLKKWIRLIGTFSKREVNAPKPSTENMPPSNTSTEKMPPSNTSTEKMQAPPLIFVGTFLDELKKTSKDYKKQIDNIQNHISKFPELSTFDFVRFCTVDNSLDNDDEELKTLRGFTTEAAEYQDQWEREIPTTWLKLELDLFNKREKGERILALADVIQMNKESVAPLKDEDEIRLALEYLHSTRSVIYFREFDYVINDPQWLADFFSILITDDQFLQHNDLLLRRDLDLYKAKGELTEKLIAGLLGVEKNKKFAPFKTVLLALMEKFGLIVKVLLPKTATENRHFSETYTIPSKIRELQNIDWISDKVNSLKCQNLAVSKTLCFVFEEVYVPTELFHRVFAHVLKTYPTADLSTRSSEKAAEESKRSTEDTDCLYMGFGCFEVNDICRMILSMHAERSTIAVTVFSPTESHLPAYSGKHVRLSIERILRETLQMSKQEHFHYSHQLHCNFHLSPYDTPVQLYGIIRSKKGVCCKGGECQGQHLLTKADTEYWDVKEDSTKTQDRESITGTTLVDKCIPNRRPTPRELGRLSSLVTLSSYRMFVSLGISEAELQTIKEKSQMLAGKTIITKMFLKWTSEYHNGTFHDIKKAMDEAELASDRMSEVIEANEGSSCQDSVPNEVWIRVPSDDEITEIVRHIGETYFNLCLELGLSPPVIEQHVHDRPNNFQEMMDALLRCWKNTFQQQATIGRLLTAMEMCDIDWYTIAQHLSRKVRRIN